MNHLVDAVLREPQPYFHVIREHLALYHAGRGREGHFVYYLRLPDNASHLAMKQKGVTIEDLWRCWNHYFTTLF